VRQFPLDTQTDSSLYSVPEREVLSIEGGLISNRWMGRYFIGGSKNHVTKSLGR
jgi:hypothetical protein